MRIGYTRVSKADGSQSLDLQRDALRAEGVDAGSDTVMVTLPDPVHVEGFGLTRGVLLVSIPMLRAAGEQAVTGDGVSALAVVWRGRTRPANTARRDPILPRIVIQSAHPARARGELLTAPGGRAGLPAASLPLFPDSVHEAASVPIGRTPSRRTSPPRGPGARRPLRHAAPD